MPSTPRPSFTPNKAPTPSTASELKIQRPSPKAASLAQPVAPAVVRVAPPATSTEAKAPAAAAAPPATALELREQPKIVRAQTSTEQLLERTAEFAPQVQRDNGPKPTIGGELDGPLERVSSGSGPVQDNPGMQRPTPTPTKGDGTGTAGGSSSSMTSYTRPDGTVVYDARAPRQVSALTEEEAEDYRRNHPGQATTVYDWKTRTAVRLDDNGQVIAVIDPSTGQVIATADGRLPAGADASRPNLLPFLLMLLFGGL